MRFSRYRLGMRGMARVLVPALGLLAAPGYGAAMEFSTVPISNHCVAQDCPRVLVANGELTAHADRRLRDFLAEQGRVPGLHAMMFLSSPGGNVETALKIGKILRDGGVAVVIGKPGLAGQGEGRGRKATLAVTPGNCASACVYTLMGARKRIVPEGARIGVHRMSARVHLPNGDSLSGGGNRVFAGEAELHALREYTAFMGGSQALISLAESTPHDTLRFLTPAELRKFRLATASR